MVETAVKYKDREFDGYDGLKSFYRDTLGIESESSSSSEDEDGEEDEMLNAPQRKKRRLNGDEPKARSKLAEQQMKESFGGLPVSRDLMGKIAEYLSLCEVGSVLVFLNKEFCGYFNTDKYWKRFYAKMSKTMMNQKQIKFVKGYKWKTGNKLYKRRLLWYYAAMTIIDITVFDDLLREYIPPLIFEIQDATYRHGNYVDRRFLIKLYLVKECVIMHYHKSKQINNQQIDEDEEEEEQEEEEKNTDESNDCDMDNMMDIRYGIDPVYLYRDDTLKVMMLDKTYILHEYTDKEQFIACWNDKKWKQMDDYGDRYKLNGLHQKIASKWKVPNDIFDVFRSMNQLYVDMKLSVIIKENVKDLQFLLRLQKFYERSMNGGNATSVIKSLCDDEETIHDDIGIDGMENDKIKVTIQSPRIVLHEQLKYIMQFINHYDDNHNNNRNGKRLCCKLEILRNELNARNIISSEQEFENIKALIDRRQFKINNDCIMYKG